MTRKMNMFFCQKESGAKLDDAMQAGGYTGCQMLRPDPSRLLITGANGFIGQVLCDELLRQGQHIRSAARSSNSQIENIEAVIVGSIDGETDWTDALRDVDIVIHLAARVHVMEETATNPLAEYLKVNLDGTTNLANQAAVAGVKQFVYVSTIKVNGEYTNEGQPFTESDNPQPQDDYAISKWKAEQALMRISQETGLGLVIVRPPLVYGPAVKANFLDLIGLIHHGIPLPFGSIKNKRSFIYVGNLVDALITCATHPAAAGQTYLVSDGDDISTSELLGQLADCMAKRNRLLKCPVWFLNMAGSVIGKASSMERLLSNLQIDSSAIRQQLSWKPKFTMRQGLQSTVDWYRAWRSASGIQYLKNRQANTNSRCNLSVVIVNYNAGEKLLECVAQVKQQSEQIIVVDNASSDSSIVALKTAFPTIRLISNNRNLGFATACNLGAKVADGDHILFLNPDCIIEPNSLSTLVKAVNSAPDVGMVGGMLINPDGTEQSGGRREMPTPWRSFVMAFGFSRLRGRYPSLFSDFSMHDQPLPDHAVEVAAISGACMLVRRDALEKIGLLDEGYFMHCEDLDWCMRFRSQKWKVLFVPDARMVHFKGHCSNSRPIFVEWNKHKGMMRFYRKYFRDRYPVPLMFLVASGVWFRFGVLTVYHTTMHIGRMLKLSRGQVSTQSVSTLDKNFL
jgi:GT2 family glycosyltransferase/nucleoside-diphosphate-sugar epimerase